MNRSNFRAHLEKRPLADALASRYPELTPAEHLRLEEAILARIADAIREGRQVGFYRQLADGSFEISVLFVDEVKGTIRQRPAR